MSDEDQERIWVQRASGADRVALTLLLASIRPAVMARVARRIPADLTGILEAEDVVQEALSGVVTSLPRFQWRGPSSFQRWAATIALNKLRDWVRAHRALRRGGLRRSVGGGFTTPSGSYVQLLDSLADPGHTPSRSMARIEAAAALHAVLDELPNDQRRAVELVYLEDRSVPGVATELGRSEHAVHQLCHKARERMRELLGDAGRLLSRVGEKLSKR